MRRVYIDFMGHRWWLFAVSGLVLLAAVAGLVVRGVNLGIEFRGGTVMEMQAKPGVTAEDVRGSLDKAGIEDVGAATIQSTSDNGFIIRLGETDAEKANTAFDAVVKSLDLPEQERNVTTIGPGWGANVSNKAMLALILSLAAIVLYISARFEYKMSITAIIALVHDAVIVLGIYALSGKELTPNTVAALLTILGYSLYDTMVVFHRIRENGQRLVKQTFSKMANDSINQVLARSINTSLSALIPAATLFVFGGPTLKDFAFALFIGLFSGAYSSIAVAAPLYTMWKEREPRYQALAKKYGQAS